MIRCKTAGMNYGNPVSGMNFEDAAGCLRASAGRAADRCFETAAEYFEMCLRTVADMGFEWAAEYFAGKNFVKAFGYSAGKNFGGAVDIDLGGAAECFVENSFERVAVFPPKAQIQLLGQRWNPFRRRLPQEPCR